MENDELAELYSKHGITEANVRDDPKMSALATKLRLLYNRRNHADLMDYDTHPTTYSDGTVVPKMIVDGVIWNRGKMTSGKNDNPHTKPDGNYPGYIKAMERSVYYPKSEPV